MSALNLHSVMPMWLTAIVLILIDSISEVDLFIGISDLTRLLHSQCLNFTPESFYSEIYAALICGKRLESPSIAQILKNLGIYHVIIVSGSHLVFLSMGIEKIFFTPRFRKFKFASFPLLFTYALATGFEPPVVRAFVGICVEAFQKKKKLFWNQNESIFISLLICFLLVDPWKSSYSLLLSYVASTILNLVSKKNLISKNFWIYSLILPFLLPLSAPSPLSFLSNMILAPLIGVVLFPLSFAAYVIPYFFLFVDPFWKVFLFICTIIGPHLESMHPMPFPLIYLWILALLLNFYGIYRK